MNPLQTKLSEIHEKLRNNWSSLDLKDIKNESSIIQSHTKTRAETQSDVETINTDEDLKSESEHFCENCDFELQ